MMFYAYFRGKAQKLISDLEAASTHVLALLSLHYSRRAQRTPVLIEDEL
jgi:biopolymer transport protein ExbB